ncbi:MAG: hypothetical protein MJZ65_05280 [Paludibacteraceae bacterium]|nr:hypothetical protein [Paludibacteraceae bacterium]
MRILFLQTAHPRKDDRVWYHQRAYLLAQGDEVEVCSTWGEERWWKKIRQAVRAIKHYEPDIVIADTPFAVLAAYRYQKVVWDITEFYPSKKDIHGGRAVAGIMRHVKKQIGRWAAKHCSGIMYGEQGKIAPYMPTKCPVLRLPYYPSAEYIPYHVPRTINRVVKLLYAGYRTTDKGWDNVTAAVRICQEQMPNIDWQLDTMQGVDYEEFCSGLSKYDLFLDLRQIDEENTQCLPIKLFYYMAAGRPSVYSRLSAIVASVPEVERCVSLVNPSDHQQVAQAIMRYATDADYYRLHALNARQLYLSHYTWESIAPDMYHFIHSL